MNFHEQAVLDMSGNIRLSPHPGVPGTCPATGPDGPRSGPSLCPLQVGVEGREGEGCGTMGLLLEHSFEIGESSNVLAWTLYLVPHEVRNSGLGPPSARHTICVLWGGERMET